MMFYEQQQKERSEQDSKLKYPEVVSQMHQSRDRQKIKQPSKFKQSDSHLRASVLIADEEGEQPSCCTRLFACTKLENYKQYFKVTNNDVFRRIKLSFEFWKGGFFSSEQDDYDFYGPFWIYTTIIFCLSAVPNILKYEVEPTFDYDFAVVGRAFGFMYVQGFLFPVILTFILKFLGTDFTHIKVICLYGYSMCPMIVCLLLCSLNSCLLHIVLLLVGVAIKILFIMKNILPEVHSARKLIVMGLIIGEGALIFFVFKLGFIICQSGTEYVNTSTLQQQIQRLQYQLDHQNHLGYQTMRHPSTQQQVFL